MEGRTYRFFKGDPLFPFGFGLSYASFTYSSVKVEQRVRAGQNISISADVTNSGTVAGDEVVQLYLTSTFRGTRVPVRTLVGVQRINLRPGEKKAVTFAVDPRAMSIVMDDGKRFVQPGEVRFSIGGEQPGFSGFADASSTTTIGGSFRITGSSVELPK